MDELNERNQAVAHLGIATEWVPRDDPRKPDKAWEDIIHNLGGHDDLIVAEAEIIKDVRKGKDLFSGYKPVGRSASPAPRPIQPRPAPQPSPALTVRANKWLPIKRLLAPIGLTLFWVGSVLVGLVMLPLRLLTQAQAKPVRTAPGRTATTDHPFRRAFIMALILAAVMATQIKSSPISVTHLTQPTTPAVPTAGKGVVVVPPTATKAKVGAVVTPHRHSTTGTPRRQAVLTPSLAPAGGTQLGTKLAPAPATQIHQRPAVSGVPNDSNKPSGSTDSKTGAKTGTSSKTGTDTGTGSGSGSATGGGASGASGGSGSGGAASGSSGSGAQARDANTAGQGSTRPAGVSDAESQGDPSAAGSNPTGDGGTAPSAPVQQF